MWKYFHISSEVGLDRSESHEYMEINADESKSVWCEYTARCAFWDENADVNIWEHNFKIFQIFARWES